MLPYMVHCNLMTNKPQMINGPVLLTCDSVSFWVTLDKDERMTLTFGTWPSVQVS